MVMRAELPDGRTLEFPDGTSPDIIQGKVKELLGVGGGTTPSPAVPTAPTSPILTPSSRAVSPGSTEAPVGEAKMSVPDAIVAETPQTIGGLAGGLAVGAANPELWPVTAGVALGAGFGESMKQVGQHLSGSLDAPRTSIESAQRIGKAALTEGGFNLLGGYVVKGFEKILKPFSKTMKEGVAEGMDYFKDKIKPVLLPAEATESRVLDVLHNVAESSLVGGNQIAKYKTARTKFFDDFADSIVDQFGSRTSPDDLGNLFVAAIEDKRKVHKEAADILYNNVSDVVNSSTRKVQRKVEDEMGGRWVTDELPGIEVPTSAIKDFASKIRVNTRELGNIEAKNAGDDLLAAVVDLPENLSFDAAKELRSRLISRVDEFSVLNRKAPAIGKAKKMINLIDQEIERALSKISIADTVTAAVRFPGSDKIYTGVIHAEAYQKAVDDGLAKDGGIAGINAISGWVDKNGKWLTSTEGMNRPRVGSQSALDAWRTANQFYREGQDKFNNTFLRRMVKLADDTGTGAENIAPAIFQPGQVSKVRKVKRALGEGSEDWNKMQGFFAQHLMSKSTDVNGNIIGKRLLNNLSGKPNSFGEPLLREVLSEPQIREIKLFATVLQEAQRKQSEGAGRMLIQLTQAGAVGALATGNFTLPAATVILGPPILSKIMLNPTTSRLLTEGVSIPASSKTAAGVMSRLVAAAERIHQRTTGE